MGATPVGPPLRHQTLAEGWSEFARKVLDPIQAGELQRKEMRRAFYAGAAQMLSSVLLAAENPDEETNLMQMALLDEELKQWARLLNRGQV